MTKIPWTNETWNPVVGCTKIAAGCTNCYAERMAWRLANMDKNASRDYTQVVNYEKCWNGKIVCRESELEKPLYWKKPRKIFVCSMGDLFHEAVPFGFIDKVFSVMINFNQHVYQILTKRPKRMAEYIEQALWDDSYDMSHLWLGTSVSTQSDADRNIPILLQMPAAVRFVSIEPMLERINFRQMLDDLYGWVDWGIFGCESGARARLCSLDDICDGIGQFIDAGKPVFIKQIPLNGKCNKHPEEWPEEFRIQEYPKSK